MYILPHRGFDILVIPETLYIVLFLLFSISALISVIAFVIGAVKKKKMKWFILWGVVVLISAVYLIAALEFGLIAANTMIGG